MYFQDRSSRELPRPWFVQEVVVYFGMEGLCSSRLAQFCRLVSHWPVQHGFSLRFQRLHDACTCLMLALVEDVDAGPQPRQLSSSPLDALQVVLSTPHSRVSGPRRGVWLPC